MKAAAEAILHRSLPQNDTSVCDLLEIADSFGSAQLKVCTLVLLGRYVKELATSKNKKFYV